MDDRIGIASPVSAPTRPTRAALVPWGVWVRIGYIGAYGLATGVMLLVQGEVRPVSALVLALGGGVLAVIGWWRGKAALAHLDASEHATVAPVLPMSAVTGGSAVHPLPVPPPSRAATDAA